MKKGEETGMKTGASLSMVKKLMEDFAEGTGLSAPGKAPRRYLWTDAFAVCNFLELYRRTADENYKSFALRLVDHVHHLLGRHREDDSRTGWISGLDERQGRAHPTRRGLRIGKKLNERKPADPFDEHLEWDRDGQYYHYLTKWMHALNRVSGVTEDPRYHRWAMELAQAAHAHFTYRPSSGGMKRMYWKMSIDLSYPLVQSMGHHDPLDGWMTYTELQATAGRYSETPLLDLHAEITDLEEMGKEKSWATDDPLGIGGLLSDAYRLAQLIFHYKIEQSGLMEDLLDSSLVGLEAYRRSHSLKLQPQYRLAFRELGLAIGLRAVERLKELVGMRPETEVLMSYVPLAETIETFWLEQETREASTWIEHRDINMVMLATSLAPDGYLTV
jgi:hypothetical protein